MRKNNSCNSALFKVLPIRSVDQSIEKNMEQNMLQRPKNRSQFVDTVQVIYFKTMREWETREDF